MYDCDCPYCGVTNTFWEIDGTINMYVAHKCTECRKIFYNLQRSWFDPFYDNHNVETRKQEWVDKMEKMGKIEKCGEQIFDIYKKNGGRKKALEVVKNMLNLIKD